MNTIATDGRCFLPSTHIRGAGYFLARRPRDSAGLGQEPDLRELRAGEPVPAAVPGVGRHALERTGLSPAARAPGEGRAPLPPLRAEGR